MDAPTCEAIQMDSGGWAGPHVLHRLVPVLQKGLGKRVKLIGQKPWECHEVDDDSL